MIAETVTSLLGLSVPGPLRPLALVSAVEEGLPLAAVERVASQVAPDDTGFLFRMVPRATLARRKRAKAARLSADEGARVARLAEVWAFAREVWGSDEDARAFLFSPHPMLDGRRPIDVVLANEFGRPLVENLLGGLRYGSAA